jgi:hypothetical protein
MPLRPEQAAFDIGQRCHDLVCGFLVARQFQDEIENQTGIRDFSAASGTSAAD